MKNVLFGAALLLTMAASAQKVTTYFPNGSKSFEGEYSMVYAQTETRDMYNFDTAADRRKASMINMTGRSMDRESMPQKVYNGKCVFYYPNGNVSFTGEYRNGVKNGLFVYSYFGGAKEAEYTYTNGMADGKWMSWFQNGKPRTEHSYTAYSAEVLDSIVYNRMSGGNPYRGSTAFVQRASLRSFAKDTLSKLPANTFNMFANLESGFFRNTCWNGTFTTWYENGKKCSEMHYKNNVRIGKWCYWDESGNVNVALTFENGKIAEAVNNLPADKERTQPSSAVRPGMTPQGGGGSNGMSDSAKAIMDKRMVIAKMPRPDVQPKPATEAQKYIKEHLEYPDAARQNKVVGAVMLRFIVNEDGTTSDFDVVRGLGHGCDEAAIKVVKSMPPWTPGQKEGKPVRSVFMLPVQFMPETSARPAK